MNDNPKELNDYRIVITDDDLVITEFFGIILDIQIDHRSTNGS